jgi:hypothetical protein
MELVGFLLYATTVPELDKLRFRKTLLFFGLFWLGLGHQNTPIFKQKKHASIQIWKAMYKKAHRIQKWIARIEW